MNDTAGLGAVAAAFKPTDLGAFEPSAGADQAFAAVVASLGSTSLQTSTPIGAQPAASIGRVPGDSGNIMPLPYLNGLPSEPVAAVPGGPSPPAEVVAQHKLTVPLIPTPEARARGSEARLAPGTRAQELSEEISDLIASPKRGSFLEQKFAAREFGAAVVEAQAARNDSTLLQNGLRFVQAHPGGENLAPVAHAPSTLAAANANGAALNAEAPFPLHHPRFAEGISQQVRLMASDGVQLARISINPPELGPVELRIVVRNDEAVVQLASSHGAVRDALEEALPRLREQFEQAGMRLGDSGVFSELPGRSPTDCDLHERFAAEAALSELEAAESVAHAAVSVSHGLVDAYV